MKERPRPITPLTLLSDEPILEIEQDGLGLESWARVIAGIAIGTEGPFTVGILGAWGVGKTSILRLAKAMIDRSEQTAHEKITTVSFNAWEYEQESSPLIPLIAAIIFELHKNADIAKTAKQAIQKLHDALASLLFGASSKVSGKIPFMGEASLTLDSNKAIERYEEIRAQWIERQVDKSVYYKAFETLKSVQLGTKRHRVVVFIDDLDRCFPDRAIQLLETIKLVLAILGLFLCWRWTVESWRVILTSVMPTSLA
jgi:predicted KAP-like P-loop ATPase